MKKEYRTIGGGTVAGMAVGAFLSTGAVHGVVVTLPAADVADAGRLLGFSAPRQSAVRIDIVAGGPTRQQSVRLGLEACRGFKPELVLIHDGARPWVNEGLIAAVLADAELTGASIPVLPSTDAMKRVDKLGRVVHHLARGGTVAAQTPQGFRFDDILRAHEAADGDGCAYVDDAEIYARYIGPVSTVPGDVRNRKITYPEDLPRP